MIHSHPVPLDGGEGRRTGPPRGVRLHRVPSLPALAGGVRAGAGGAHHGVGLEGRWIALIDEGEERGRCPCPGRAEVAPGYVDVALETDHQGSISSVQARAAGRLVAEIVRRWGMGSPSRSLSVHASDAWDVDLIPFLPDGEAESVAGGDRPRLLCLIAVRNGGPELRRMLDAASVACDAILALNDGSTDATGELLAATPAVRAVLRNPARSSDQGWHDGANRNRLLAAAAALDPGWVLFLDADEIVPEPDARRLRRLVGSDPDPSAAYGFRLVRMWGEREREVAHRWVYRLFAHRPGVWVPTRRLHFDPVPADIPRARYRHTGIRIQHLGRRSEARLRASRQRYRQADPAQAYGGWTEEHRPDPRWLSPWDAAGGGGAG